MSNSAVISNYSRIIDISVPVSSTTACFPGDTPFSRSITLTHRDTGIVNLTAMTMSPHVGTHADSPIHIKGDMDDDCDMAADLPLDAYIGPARVIDLAPYDRGITAKQFLEKIEGLKEKPKRVLFKTCHHMRYHVFEDKYAHMTTEVVESMAQNGVILAGIDTPSVDDINSKTLDSHHRLDQHRLCWLENLELTKVEEGDYFLIALPIKYTELEASPVRAVLLA